MAAREVFVRMSADPTFMRTMLVHWTDCIARYHEFHTPEAGHPQYNSVVWDSIMGQIERSQVSVLVSAAWLSGGVGMTEISTRIEGCRSEGKRKSKTRFGDFYLCSPGFVVFEGECKLAEVFSGNDANQIKTNIVSSLNAAKNQHNDLLHNRYSNSPTYISFIRIAERTAESAAQTFGNCLQAIRELARENDKNLQGSLTAYAAQETPANAPIEWDNGLFHPGSIICIRECAPRVETSKNQ